MIRLSIAISWFACLVLPAWTQDLETLSVRGRVQQLHLYGNRLGTPIILSSGDLGWAGLVLHVAEVLSSKSHFVVGFNSKVYLESFTTKESA